MSLSARHARKFMFFVMFKSDYWPIKCHQIFSNICKAVQLQSVCDRLFSLPPVSQYQIWLRTSASSGISSPRCLNTSASSSSVSSRSTSSSTPSLCPSNSSKSSVLARHLSLQVDSIKMLNCLKHVCLCYREHPVFLIFMQLAVISIFKSYPTVGDIALYLAFLPVWSHLHRCECIKHRRC